MKEKTTKKSTISTEQSVEINNNEVINENVVDKINDNNLPSDDIIIEENIDINEPTKEVVIEEETINIKSLDEPVIEENIDINEPTKEVVIEEETINIKSLDDDIIEISTEINNNVNVNTEKVILSGKLERLMRRNGNIKF